MCFGSLNADAASGPVASTTLPASGKLIITGSSTMAPMITAVAKRFMALHPGVQLDVQSTGSGQGIADVTAGRANIGMASRALTDGESALFSFAVARDGVGLIVHKDNPIRSLTNRQVFDIFTGKINNWSKVGGKAAAIAPINAKAGFGAVELFTHYFEIPYADIKAQLVVSDNLARINAIIANPNGITYLSAGTAQSQVAAGSPIKMLPIDDVAATTKNIRSGNFPLSRPLLLVTKDLPSGLVKDFINFALSSQITDVVVQHEFVPYLD
jgi:phosphate transport system substrate-binding protein